MPLKKHLERLQIESLDLHITMKENNIFNKNSLPEALGETDPATLMEFYSIFITHSLSNWNQAKTAAEQEDWKKVHAVAHSLKSSSNSIGALAMSRAMEDLESLAASGPVEESDIKQADKIVKLTEERIKEFISAGAR